MNRLPEDVPGGKVPAAARGPGQVKEPPADDEFSDIISAVQQ